MEERFLSIGEPISPERPRHELGPEGKVLVGGLRRFAVFVGIAAGISVGLAVGIALLRGSDVTRAASLGLYLGGAALVAVPVFSWGGRGVGGYVTYDLDELSPQARRRWQGEHAAYLVIGVTLVLLGILLETVTR